MMQTLSRPLLRKLLALPLLALILIFAPGQASAEARVFDLITPRPEEVLQVIQTTYGDKVRAELIQSRLVVVGSKKQIDEIATLLEKLDRSPAALRLTLRETPPPTIEHEGTVVYSSGDDGRVIDTVEGALVAVDYQQVVQQPSTNGWLVAIENQPLTVSSLTLQIQLQNPRVAQVMVSFADERNQQRRVYGNTLTGEIGEWIPLLPRKAGQLEGPGAYSTGAKKGQQLYLRIEKNSAKAQ